MAASTEQLKGRALEQELARRLTPHLRRPAKVILFGSHARGDITEHSDIDLLVIEPDIGESATEAYMRLRPRLGYDLGSIDVVGCTPERFERRRLWPGSVWKRADREGHVIVDVA